MKNDMFLCQKFEKEYRIVVHNMSNEEEGWTEESPIPYRPCGSVLTTLGFLPPDMPPESEDYSLFKDLWDMMEGEQRSGITVENLLYCLLIIRGARLPQRECDFEEKESAFLKLAKMDSKGVLNVLPGG